MTFLVKRKKGSLSEECFHSFRMIGRKVDECVEVSNISKLRKNPSKVDEYVEVSYISELRKNLSFNTVPVKLLNISFVVK